MGVSLAILGSIERGTRRVDDRMLQRIAEALHVDPQEIKPEPLG